MKKYILLLIILGVSTLFYSCEDMFLQKPETSGTVDLNAAFSTTKNAEAALFSCYRRTLIQGWPGGWGGYHGNLGSISGERARGYNWHLTYEISQSGLKASVSDAFGASGMAGADNFPETWACIRSCFLVKENIDKAVDMTDEKKGYVKAECTGLIAYRYMGMFYRYGGVPIVTKSFLIDDDMSMPRASLQETLNYIISLCDEAIAGLPDAWSNDYYGRMTKGAALAIKARTLLFAARPLFNSSTPYLDFGDYNNRICFGSADLSRWQQAIDANEAVLTWANTNGYALINTGGAGVGQPNPNAINDYGTATSTPANKEVLLAYKVDEAKTNLVIYYNTSKYNTYKSYQADNVGLLTNFLEYYYNKQGQDPIWAKVGDVNPKPAQQWLDNVANMEARFRLDYMVPGVSSLCNPGDNFWSVEGYSRYLSNYAYNTQSFPNANGEGKGCGSPTKFYYKAGSRVWFEPPLFRIAETYLNLAEAYNELENTSKALEYLNSVHNRAGLPSLVETNTDSLRRRIWRERAIELVGENHRYFDVKHWKHPDITNGIIGGQFRELQFYITGTYPNRKASLQKYWDAKTNVGYWHPKMYLEPFPQLEVNKGFIKQTPDINIYMSTLNKENDESIYN